jgi:hypothetical protein
MKHRTSQKLFVHLMPLAVATLLLLSSAAKPEFVLNISSYPELPVVTQGKCVVGPSIETPRSRFEAR